MADLRMARSSGWQMAEKACFRGGEDEGVERAVGEKIVEV